MTQSEVFSKAASLSRDIENLELLLKEVQRYQTKTVRAGIHRNSQFYTPITLSKQTAIKAIKNTIAEKKKEIAALEFISLVKELAE